MDRHKLRPHMGEGTSRRPLSARYRGRGHWDSGERVRILAVDDDPNDLRYVRDTLAGSGYEPVVTGDPEEAVRLMGEARPELVLLDLMLPGTDGMELMREILDVADVPVIFLSAYGREEVVVRAFEMGAVDYVVKPFSSTERYVLGDLTIDYAERRVTLAGRRVRLTPTEYGMLAELSAHAGRVLTHEHLLERVWRDRGDGSVRPMHTMSASSAASWAPPPATPPTSSPSPASASGYRRERRRRR